MNLVADLVSTLGGLYLLAILLRFLLQIARADFYNPLSQAVVRITDPLVRVFRTFIPGYRGLDFSSLILALVVEGLLIFLLISLYGYQMPGIGSIVTWSLAGVLLFILNIYFYAILAAIIMSFVMMFSGNMNPHPALQLIWQLTEPVMRPVRSLLPPIGGLDFSPILIFLAIEFLIGAVRSVFGITDAVRQVVVGI
jgi:YggT family protein